MTSEDVIRLFVHGETGRAGNIESTKFPDGTVILSSYNTPIAVKYPNGKIEVSTKKYSVTTSKHQNSVTRSLTRAQFAYYPIEEITIAVSVST